jgi:hypothetical protein
MRNLIPSALLRTSQIKQEFSIGYVAHVGVGQTGAASGTCGTGDDGVGDVEGGGEGGCEGEGDGGEGGRGAEGEGGESVGGGCAGVGGADGERSGGGEDGSGGEKEGCKGCETHFG